MYCVAFIICKYVQFCICIIVMNYEVVSFMAIYDHISYAEFLIVFK